MTMTTERYRQQAESFVAETLNAEIPGVATDAGSGTNNILVRGGGAIHAALHQEIDHTLTSRNISDPDAISEADMDRNLENVMAKRDAGQKSRLFVNVHFAERRDRVFGQGTRASTADKLLVFVTESDLSFLESDYIVEPSDNTFFLRVPMIAEKAGPEYDVDVGEVNNLIDNRLGAVYIRNASLARGGLPAQTNSEFLRSASRDISTRLPINTDGTLRTIQKLFGTRVLDVLVIGNGDPEMLRDELYDNGGVIGLGPTGTPTGVHVGGRADVYHWYPQVNYVEVTIDLTIDLIAAAAIPGAAATVTAKFAPGSTTTNTVPASGALVLDLGGATEETVRYASFVFDVGTGVYTFTLASGVTTAMTHAISSPVKIAGTGAISIAPGGAINTLPILRVQSVRLLDPLTLSPIGSPLTEVDAAARAPGWRFADQSKLNFMSAKETRTLVVDEKRDALGNAALSKSDGVTSATRLLSSPTTTFTGYQGRDITITAGGVTQTRTILRVVTPNEIEYSDGATPLPDAGSVVFTVAAGFGDYLQYPVRIGFYTHTEIQEAQATFDGGRVRVLTGNNLSRAFLPVFLDFKLRFKGSGSEADVRAKVLELIQDSQGNVLGTNQGARFDASDIVAAAYADGMANFVETPFEIKITRINVDGTKTVKWVSPGRDTVNDLVIATAAAVSDKIVTCTRPVQVAEFSVPATGKLYLGAYVGNQETVTYDRVVFSGANMIFVLTEGQSVAYVHGLNEPLRVSVSDFDPANVITDGVIASERQQRPYFGAVIVEKIP